MRKKLIAAVLLSCIAALAVAGAAVYFTIYRPFDVVEAKVEIGAPFTDMDLQSCVRQFENDRNKGYIDYMRKGFEFESDNAGEYCVATVSVKVNNPSKLTTSALYLFPKADNDVVCYLEPYMKAVSLSPGETKEVDSRFVCRRKNMSDKELSDFIGGLEFYLLENDNIFGKKKIKVSLNEFTSK